MISKTNPLWNYLHINSSITYREGVDKNSRDRGGETRNLDLLELSLHHVTRALPDQLHHLPGASRATRRQPRPVKLLQLQSVLVVRNN